MQDPLNALFQVGPLPETLLHDSKRRIRINLKPIRLIRVFIRASRTLTPITNRKTIRHYQPSILSPWWPTGDPSRVQYESKRLSAKMYGPNVQFKIPCTFLFGRRLWCNSPWSLTHGRPLLDISSIFARSSSSRALHFHPSGLPTWDLIRPINKLNYDQVTYSWFWPK